jgi:serine/threonine protein kinase
MNSPDNKDHHPNHQQHRSIHPPFPEPGSTIGPDGKFFCLGRLGKGTFCAIHKCVDLSYSHHHQRSSSSSLPPPSLVVSSSSSSQLTQSPTPKTADANDKNDTTSGDGTKSLVNISSSRKQRIVAAKVELANFVDSGVIDGEASVLKFLDVSLPDGMVPIFVDYVRQPPPSTTLSASATSSSSSAEATVVTPGTTIMDKSSSAATSADGGLSAIIMEHLPGEDMHLLRDRHCQTLLLEKSENGLSSSITSGAGGGGAGGSMSTGEKVPRRLSIQDSVYLVAEVMLPLLKAMHEVGMVHRDVKPSVSIVNDDDDDDDVCM